MAALCEALRTRCEAGPPRARLSFHLSIGTCLNWLGQPLRAEPELQQARRLAEALGDHSSAVNVTHQQLRNALLLGNAPRAQAAAIDCGKAVQAGGFGISFRLHAWTAQALAAVAAARPAAALTALRALDAATVGMDLHSDAEVAAARIVAWCALGGEVPAGQELPGCEGWLALAHWRLATTPAAQQDALDAMARRWPAEDGVMGLRRRVLAARLTPPEPPVAEALVAELRERALWPLARQAHVIAAKSLLLAAPTGLADGSAPAWAQEAAESIHQALALAAHLDPWTDEHAALWIDAAAVFRTLGRLQASEMALATGRAWVARAAEELIDPADRLLWCHQHSLHRALLAGQ